MPQMPLFSQEDHQTSGAGPWQLSHRKPGSNLAVVTSDSAASSVSPRAGACVHLGTVCSTWGENGQQLNVAKFTTFYNIMSIISIMNMKTFRPSWCIWDTGIQHIFHFVWRTYFNNLCSKNNLYLQQTNVCKMMKIRCESKSSLVCLLCCV